MRILPHERGPAAVFLLLALTLAPASARADAFAQVLNAAATLEVSPGVPGVAVNWNTLAPMRYVNSQAFVDHTDGPSQFNQDAQAYEVAGSGSTAVNFLSTGAISRVQGARATAVDMNNRMKLEIDEAYAFAHSIPPSVAFADGLVEVQNTFTLDWNSPDPQPATVPVTLILAGAVDLLANSLPGEGWTLSYQLHYEVYDLMASSAPLVLGNLGNSFDSSGPFSFSDTLAAFQLLEDLEFGREYTVYAWFDSEAAAFAIPAPGAAGVLIGAGALALGRRRVRA